MRIDTYEKLVASLALQNENLPTYKTHVGATDEDLTEVGNDHANLVYVDNYGAAKDAKKKTVFQIKQALYNGDPNDAISPFPAFDAAAPPFPLVAGAVERSNKRNKRFKAADGYTKEIGIALGIDGDTPSISPDSVKPTLEAFPAQTNYDAAVVIANRGKSDMWKVFGRKMGSETWVELASGTGKGGNVHVTPTAPGQPERMELKVQLYRSNEPYGQQSDPVYATFNP